MGRASIAESNVAAEARAVEAGLRAYVQDRWIKVLSSSWREKFYEVQPVVHLDGLISFSCQPQGRAAYRDDHLYATSAAPGVLPCLHAACAARSLVRHGLARLDSHGRFVVTAKAWALTRPADLPADPLAGLPR